MVSTIFEPNEYFNYLITVVNVYQSRLKSIYNDPFFIFIKAGKNLFTHHFLEVPEINSKQYYLPSYVKWSIKLFHLNKN